MEKRQQMMKAIDSRIRTHPDSPSGQPARLQSHQEQDRGGYVSSPCPVPMQTTCRLLQWDNFDLSGCNQSAGCKKSTSFIQLSIQVHNAPLDRCDS
jgi:hypothetical protein